jgi:hypothetical protein
MQTLFDGYRCHVLYQLLWQDLLCLSVGLDQTRGWFYTLMVLSTALFDKPAFKNLVCNGLVLAGDGKKMSKRLKNYPVGLCYTCNATCYQHKVASTGRRASWHQNSALVWISHVDKYWTPSGKHLTSCFCRPIKVEHEPSDLWLSCILILSCAAMYSLQTHILELCTK